MGWGFLGLVYGWTGLSDGNLVTTEVLAEAAEFFDGGTEVDLSTVDFLGPTSQPAQTSPTANLLTIRATGTRILRRLLQHIFDFYDFLANGVYRACLRGTGTLSLRYAMGDQACDRRAARMVRAQDLAEKTQSVTISV